MPTRSPKLAVAAALIGLAIAATLVVVAVACSAPVPIAAAYAAVAVLIVAAPCRLLLTAARAQRNVRRANCSEALAELRRDLAALPETSHPLGL
jgi:predicted lysophospholipase L1 biosynthesis ABC-type transport system permease subunit